MKYGLLVPTSLRRKPRMLMNHIRIAADKAGIKTAVSNKYRKCDTLVFYGWGGQVQQEAIASHQGDYVALDLGYWLRDGTVHRHWRVAINGFHSPERIMQGPTPSSSRWRQAKLAIGPDRVSDGHILLIGNAPKSNRVIPPGWSAKKAKEIRSYFPGKQLHYRGKPGRPIEGRVQYDRLATGDIDEEIKRASLVVCRHSNVAVDACRLGVPVVCEDGAAAAIYPHSLKRWDRQPDLATRQEFMVRLAWWQWSISQIRAGEFWPWLEGQLET